MHVVHAMHKCLLRLEKYHSNGSRYFSEWYFCDPFPKYKKGENDRKQDKEERGVTAADCSSKRRMAEIQVKLSAAPVGASDVKLPEEVVTHPLVLLSIVDHYNRVAKDTSKRVVGVLLGSTFQGKCDITNSFAVPFDEDLRNPGIWYLDHDFLENMYHMFKKINGAFYGVYAGRLARGSESRAV